MPAYITSEWEQWKLKFRAKPIGIRRFIPIPYFSGTMLEVGLIMINASEKTQEIYYSGELFLLPEIAHATTEPIKRSEGVSVTINPNSKVKQKLQLTDLPQPGNYSLRLDLELRGRESKPWDGRSAYCDILYFDALPRDASITNWTINIVMLVLGTILGGLAGWIAGSIGS